MLRATFTLLLLATAAAAQNVSQWTDGDGEVHYTNDPDTIPPQYRAKSRVTQGSELGVVHTPGATAPALPKAPVGPQVSSPLSLLEVRPDEGIEDLISDYAPARSHAFVKGVLTRRFPFGWKLISVAGEPCLDRWLTQTASAADVLGQLSHAVHECGHTADLAQRRLIFSEERGLACRRPSGPFRNTLLKDAFAARRPACEGAAAKGVGCDAYADLYLTGISGAQGFEMLVEEWHQYVHSLLTELAITDQRQAQVSARDGLLTFNWYIGRYLQLLRLKFPRDYTALVEDECWHATLKELRARARFALERTAGIKGLGIDDQALEALANELSFELTRAIDR